LNKISDAFFFSLLVSFQFFWVAESSELHARKKEESYAWNLHCGHLLTGVEEYIEKGVFRLTMAEKERTE